MNNKLLIGAGLLSLAGISYYIWKKNKDSEANETKPEEKSNAFGVRNFNRSKVIKRAGKFIPKKEDIALKNGRVATVIIPPLGTGFQPTDIWVSSTEGGKNFCRWYDKNGNNTVTYERPCTVAQANMKGGGTPD